jgi:hypothetical protein
MECMMIVMKCVNERMNKIDIKGLWGEMNEKGEIIMKG